MECPGCGSIIPADAQQCPLCKYLLQTSVPATPLLNTTIGVSPDSTATGSGVGDKLASPIRPYALPYWPLAGLVGGGVVALVVISLLVGNLLQGKGLGAIIAPSVTATPLAITAAADTPTLAPTAMPPTGIAAPLPKGKPTATPATPIYGTPIVVGTTPGALPPTATPGLVFVTAINCGGGASGQFQSDTDVVGGGVYGVSAAIDTSGVSDPAPQGVYQTERWGDFTYTLTGLTPGSAYVVRLHFAEIYFNQPNQRQFNVSINGQSVLTNFDIVAAAGGSNKAVVAQFATSADGQGQVVVNFTTGAINNPKCSGIELLQGVLATG